MPRMVDKIIINSGGLRSFRQIMKGWFAGIGTVMLDTQTLADEIESHGWGDDLEAKAILERQVGICKEADEACVKFIKALNKCHSEQMKLNEQTRVWIDVKLAAQNQP